MAPGLNLNIGALTNYLTGGSRNVGGQTSFAGTPKEFTPKQNNSSKNNPYTGIANPSISEFQGTAFNKPTKLSTICIA